MQGRIARVSTLMPGCGPAFPIRRLFDSTKRNSCINHLMLVLVEHQRGRSQTCNKAESSFATPADRAQPPAHRAAYRLTSSTRCVRKITLEVASCEIVVIL